MGIKRLGEQSTAILGFVFASVGFYLASPYLSEEDMDVFKINGDDDDVGPCGHWNSLIHSLI